MSTDDIIIRTFVIRRPLEGMWFGKNILAHSALLLLTKTGKHFLIERLAGDVGVGCLEVNFTIEKLFDAHQEIFLNGKTWTKQLRGQEVVNGHTVDEAKAFLRDYVENNPYDVRGVNCHLAQEELRRWLGLNVPRDKTITILANWIASWAPKPAVESSAKGGHEESDSAA